MFPITYELNPTVSENSLIINMVLGHNTDHHIHTIQLAYLINPPRIGIYIFPYFENTEFTGITNDPKAIEARCEKIRLRCASSKIIDAFVSKNIEKYNGMFKWSWDIPPSNYEQLHKELRFWNVGFSYTDFELTKDECNTVITDFVNTVQDTLGMTKNTREKLIGLLTKGGYQVPETKNKVPSLAETSFFNDPTMRNPGTKSSHKKSRQNGAKPEHRMQSKT